MIKDKMEKKVSHSEQQSTAKRSPKKTTEYGKQLYEKQRVKHMYGMRERQFRRFYADAVKTIGAPGENLLSFLERRLDNVLYRLKFATSRTQARQMVVHGHVLVNSVKTYSPSYRVHIDDLIGLDAQTITKKGFLDAVVDKRLKTGIKVPEWLELDKKNYTGRILRAPVRADLQTPIEEQLIVALYSGSK